jgi:hypothetical protein
MQSIDKPINHRPLPLVDRYALPSHGDDMQHRCKAVASIPEKNKYNAACAFRLWKSDLAGQLC